MINNKAEDTVVRKRYSPQFKDPGGDSIENQKLQQAEIFRLKREVGRLAEENAFLKKAAALCQGIQLKYAMIKEQS